MSQNISSYFESSALLNVGIFLSFFGFGYVSHLTNFKWLSFVEWHCVFW